MWGLVLVGPLLLPGYPGDLAVVRPLSRVRADRAAAGLVRPRGSCAQLTRADWREALRLALVGNIVYYLFLAAALPSAPAGRCRR